MSIYGKQKVSGKMYIAHFKGISECLKAYEFAESHTNDETINYFFEHFITEPKGLKMTDFEDLKDCLTVFELTRAVASGNFDYLYKIEVK